jgi:peptide/nickel transport system ATP-binding protein
MDGDVVIQVSGLKKYFELKKGFFSFETEPVFVKALDNVSFSIREGEILGLVGESGCGKTTTGRLLTRLEDPTEGSVLFLGRDIALLEDKDLKVFRRNIQMVFQDPYESLNPRTNVLQTIMEPLINHHIGSTFEDRVKIVTKALEDAGLAPAKEYLARFPHELSGGQRQRVSIARSLVLNPRVIVADEPVSMLDVSIRAGVLNLMLDLREKYKIPYLFITHDIAVARYVSDRLAVMYLGKIVELAETDEIIFQSKHPYTQALLSAVPVPDPEHKHGRVLIRGEVPSAINVPLGCRFRPRCPKAFEECGWQGSDLAEWLLEEEKINQPDHPLNSHVDKVHPTEFAVTIDIKEGGSPAKVREFIESNVAAQIQSRPMFRAIHSIQESIGDLEIVVPCSSARLTAEQVAESLLRLLNETVGYRNVDNPLHGVILDIQRQGPQIALMIVPAQAKARLESMLSFLNDFVKHYRFAGYPELRGVSEVRTEPSGSRVVASCRGAVMPPRRVSKEVAKMIANDIAADSRSAFFNHLLPPKAEKNRVKIVMSGPKERWDMLAEELKKYFGKKASEGDPVSKAVGNPQIKQRKGPANTVVVNFIKAEEPPLVDVGGGHTVACLLFKQAKGK